MSDEITAFDRALLAELAYANLTTNMSPQDFIDKCMAVGIPKSLAEYAHGKFRVVASCDDGSTGYYGVVFASINTGEYFFCNRGTEDRDAMNDLLIADVLQIGLTGAATGQANSMVQFFDRVLSLVGQGAHFEALGHSLGAHLSVALGFLRGAHLTGINSFNTPKNHKNHKNHKNQWGQTPLLIKSVNIFNGITIENIHCCHV